MSILKYVIKEKYRFWRSRWRTIIVYLIACVLIQDFTGVSHWKMIVISALLVFLIATVQDDEKS